MQNRWNLHQDLVYDTILLCFLHLLHFGTLQRKLGVIFTFKELLKTTGSRNKSQWFSENIINKYSVYHSVSLPYQIYSHLHSVSTARIRWQLPMVLAIVTQGWRLRLSSFAKISEPTCGVSPEKTNLIWRWKTTSLHNIILYITFGSWSNPKKDPCKWYIYIHEWLIYDGKCR